MHSHSRLTVLMVTAIHAGATLHADIPVSRPDPRLRESATHVVRGVVNGVYSAEREIKPGYVDVVYIVEMKVEGLDKGTGPTIDGLLYARTWKSKRRPAGFEGPAGQARIPDVGDRVYACLKIDRTGGYDLLVPSGIGSFASTTR